MVSAPHFPTLPESQGAGRGPAGTRTLPGPALPEQEASRLSPWGSQPGSSCAPHPSRGGHAGGLHGVPTSPAVVTSRGHSHPREAPPAPQILRGEMEDTALQGGGVLHSWGTRPREGREAHRTWGGRDLAQGRRGSPTSPHELLSVGHPYNPGVWSVRGGSPQKPRGTLLEPERGHAPGWGGAPLQPGGVTAPDGGRPLEPVGLLLEMGSPRSPSGR